MLFRGYDASKLVVTALGDLADDHYSYHHAR